MSDPFILWIFFLPKKNVLQVLYSQLDFAVLICSKPSFPAVTAGNSILDKGEEKKKKACILNFMDFVLIYTEKRERLSYYMLIYL